MISYKKVIFPKTQLKSVDKFEGQFLHKKIRRMLEMDEPIGELAPRIYTEKKDGVMPDYNIRTDKWEYASNAMDYIHRDKIAKGNGAIDVEGATINSSKGDPLDSGGSGEDVG